MGPNNVNKYLLNIIISIINCCVCVIVADSIKTDENCKILFDFFCFECENKEYARIGNTFCWSQFSVDVALCYV